MNIIEIEVSKIKPYKKNAKKHDETQINNVAESIKQFGFVQPIVLDKKNEIVIGHCRFEASKKLGMEKVPCLYVDDLTQEQIDALRLVDNKTNESTWDYEILSNEISDVPEYDFTEFGFGEFEIISLQNKEDVEVKEDVVTKATETETAEPDAENIDKNKRKIFIIHNEEEKKWFTETLGIKGELMNVYRILTLMNEEKEAEAENDEN